MRFSPFLFVDKCIFTNLEYKIHSVLPKKKKKGKTCSDYII